VERVLSSDLAAHVGELVTIQGWLHRQRRLANVSFLVLRDRAGLAQVVLAEPVELLPETVLEVRGRVVTEPQLEVHDAQVAVLAQPAEQAPLELHRPQPKEIHTPKLVGAATEGGANVFRVDYFGRDAFLAQSPQLYKQAMVGVFERVYEVGPAFRAEPHDTGRHLSEFTSLDAELGFIRDHRDVMTVTEACVLAMLEATGPIPVVHFEDVRSGDEPDLSPEDERRICAEHGELVFVEGFPTAKRAFYTHPDPDRPAWSRGFDLLYRGTEIVSGAQRLHRYDDYLTALRARGLDPASFAGYLQAFRYGMPPHGGFAIGLPRLVAQATGLGNLRETTLFPRDRSRLTP